MSILWIILIVLLVLLLLGGSATRGARRPGQAERPLGTAWPCSPPRLPGGEPAVDRRGALAALVDRPHDQRLAAARVAGGEHAGDRRRVASARRRCRAGRGSTPSCSSSACSRMEEAHREQHEVGRALSSVPGDRRRTAARRSSCAQWICSTPCRLAARAAWSTIAKSALAALLQRVRACGASSASSGHGVRSSGRVRGRLAEQLELRHRARRPRGCALRDAVRAGVAAADHDHVLARGGDHRRRRRGGAAARGPSCAATAAVALVEVVHREVDAVELAARAPAGRAATREPIASTTASKLGAQLVDGRRRTPTSTPQRNSTPSATSCCDAALDDRASRS